MRSRRSRLRLNPKRWFIDRQQHHRPRLVSEGFASQACENYASETSWGNAHHRRKAETLMRRYFRTPTPCTARSCRTDQASTTSLIGQVLGITVCIFLGLVSEGLASHTVSPTELTFCAVQGTTTPPPTCPAKKTLTFTKVPTTRATLTASDNATWLTVSPPSQSVTTRATITVTVANISSFAAGTYKATVTVKEGTWFTKTIPVTLIISSTGGGGSGTTSSATLQWNAVTGTISGYKIYVWDANSSYANSSYKRTITVGTGTSTIVNSLPVGKTYSFAVTAYNSAGESGWSNVVNKAIP
jgi:Fibronectin type III domain